ncbi:MAG: trypsin-like peptidase domain-containing protein [Proteobacteria bacterium]|nr:trypsin-like peptidase domain-containing protein [Pseudomonadota bacterium]
MLALLVLTAAAAPTMPSWEETLDRVVPGVVSLRVTATRDFDTENAGNSVGTGFVVDAERGIILTNRHMVHAGPVLAEAVLLNNEELDLEPIYRDPVHDFGFYRYDPGAVKFMELPELELAPERARVGMSIRVIGNDAGEKISILDSTLARLDRAAPRYGRETYNDFNTFYLQAATGTSGGSSGSPVVDQQGLVVGLNAGGSREAASSFYLPLDRVVRALDLIREDEPVARGTLLTTLIYRPYDECRRLGLSDSTEAGLRESFPDGTGALVVERVLPNGPADGVLQSGDVVVAVDGEPLGSFVPLEARLDERVGEKVELQIERGGETQRISLDVQDLHAVTPSNFLEVGRGVLHDLSYHQARTHAHPLDGVYVAVPGYMWSRGGVGGSVVITAIDGVSTTNLDALQAELETKADGQRFQVRSHSISDRRHDRIDVVTMDRTWYPMRRCVRDDSDGSWPCQAAAAAPEPPREAAREVLPPPAPDKVSARIADALVMVDFDVPYSTAGVRNFNYQGVGTVFDAERGLVLVDRDTVPVALGDITLTFAASLRVPGRLIYLDPIHNTAVVQYDPAKLGDTPVGEVEFIERTLDAGSKLWQVGLDRHHQVVSSQTTVERVQPIALAASGTPRFRDINAVGTDLVSTVPSLGGVLVDKKGRALALWASFLDPSDGERGFRGLPTTFLPAQVRGVEAERCGLGVELGAVPLAEARERGLADFRAKVLVALDPRWRRVLEVKRVDGLAPAIDVLTEGDLLVGLGVEQAEPISRFEDIEALGSLCGQELKALVYRDGGEMELSFTPQALDTDGVERIISWAGMVLHAPHHDVSAQQGITPEGVYIAWLWYGTPGSRYGMRPTRRITHVDGEATPDLDAFLQAVGGLSDRESVRLTTVLLDGSMRVVTLRLDLEYWPTVDLRAEQGVWRRATVE